MRMVGVGVGGVAGQAWKRNTSLSLSCHSLEFSPLATPNSKEKWET